MRKHSNKVSVIHTEIVIFTLDFSALTAYNKNREIPTFHIFRSAIYAMQVLQQELVGEAERTGLTSEDDVMELVKELRNEDKNP